MHHHNANGHHHRRAGGHQMGPEATVATEATATRGHGGHSGHRGRLCVPRPFPSTPSHYPINDLVQEQLLQDGGVARCGWRCVVAAAYIFDLLQYEHVLWDEPAVLAVDDLVDQHVVLLEQLEVSGAAEGREGRRDGREKRQRQRQRQTETERQRDREEERQAERQRDRSRYGVMEMTETACVRHMLSHPRGCAHAHTSTHIHTIAARAHVTRQHTTPGSTAGPPHTPSLVAGRLVCSQARPRSLT